MGDKTDSLISLKKNYQVDFPFQEQGIAPLAIPYYLPMDPSMGMYELDGLTLDTTQLNIAITIIF